MNLHIDTDTDINDSIDFDMIINEHHNNQDNNTISPCSHSVKSLKNHLSKKKYVVFDIDHTLTHFFPIKYLLSIPSIRTQSTYDISTTTLNQVKKDLETHIFKDDFLTNPDIDDFYTRVYQHIDIAKWPFDIIISPKLGSMAFVMRPYWKECLYYLDKLDMPFGLWTGRSKSYAELFVSQVLVPSGFVPQFVFSTDEVDKCKAEFSSLKSLDFVEKYIGWKRVYTLMIEDSIDVFYSNFCHCYLIRPFHIAESSSTSPFMSKEPNILISARTDANLCNLILLFKEYFYNNQQIEELHQLQYE